MTKDSKHWVEQHGQQKLDEAKRMVNDCKTGYYIVHDRENNSVYYRDAHSENRIDTQYTDEHILIAYRVFPRSHPQHIQWDRMNSEYSKSSDFYKTSQS
jgi:hypothetical protein